MSAKILDGKKSASELLWKLKQFEYNRPPCFAIYSIGDDPASQVYIRKKVQTATDLGYKVIVREFSAREDEGYIASIMRGDAANPDIDGMMLQLPIPPDFYQDGLISLIPPEKDIDGLTFMNKGRLQNKKAFFIPCTPRGIVTLLMDNGITFGGKHVVIVGRSDIVGKPMAMLALNMNATVTVCHSWTPNLAEMTKQADILIVAIGKANFITANMVKPGAVVVDVGINRNEDGKLCGDVDFENVKEVAGWITPVPGGVGPMTVATLMENVDYSYIYGTTRHERKKS